VRFGEKILQEEAIEARFTVLLKQRLENKKHAKL